MDKRVEIHGTSRTDMNGKRGVAVDFHINREDRTKDRYTVQLDSGEAFKVKPANVRAVDKTVHLTKKKERDEGEGKGKGKKGKKGRAGRK